MLRPEFENQIRKLTPPERDELLALLSAMAISDDPELQEDLAGKIDDKNPRHWASLDELRRMSASSSPS